MTAYITTTDNILPLDPATHPKDKTGDTTARQIDRVFFALSDATRRALLDRLYTRAGQRVGELAADFDMSRQAVSKHLDVLEDTGLIVTRRVGRQAHYFLNRAPIRQVQDLWIAKYTRYEVRVDCS
jgi:DNA-binding transcriptional ArsR family regulator